MPELPPRDGQRENKACPTCDEFILSVFTDGVWRLPPHKNKANNDCPTRRKKP